METYRAHVEDSQWSQADYELTWDPDSKVLIYRAEGRDNPKDLWGFDNSYPPLVMDRRIMAEIEKVFGLTVRQRIAELVPVTPEEP